MMLKVKTRLELFYILCVPVPLVRMLWNESLGGGQSRLMRMDSPVMCTDVDGACSLWAVVPGGLEAYPAFWWVYVARTRKFCGYKVCRGHTTPATPTPPPKKKNEVDFLALRHWHVRLKISQFWGVANREINDKKRWTRLRYKQVLVTFVAIVARVVYPFRGDFCHRDGINSSVQIL